MPSEEVRATAPGMRRAGFALPLAILVIAMLTAAVAAGFAATASEAVANNAQRAQERAYQLAEAGLQQFLVRRSESGFCTGCVTDPTAAVDSEYTRVQLTGGYADVVVKRVWSPVAATDPMFFIRSKGVDTAARLGGSGGALFAERTVGLYAKWSNKTMNVLAALTSYNGVYRSTGVVDGNEYCPGPGWTDLPYDVKVLANSGNSGSWSGHNVDASESLTSLKASQGIDWDKVQSGAISADVTIPPGSWPSGGGYTNWPIIRVKTNAGGNMPNVVGQGLIIADSNFVLPAGGQWNGVILVGGTFKAQSGSGQSRVRGAVVTGLNWTLTGAGTPPVGVTTDNDSLKENSLDLYYYPCYVTDAGHKLRGYTPMPNTWMDNVATW